MTLTALNKKHEFYAAKMREKFSKSKAQLRREHWEARFKKSYENSADRGGFYWDDEETEIQGVSLHDQMVAEVIKRHNL
jgi:hypothetical protein